MTAAEGGHEKNDNSKKETKNQAKIKLLKVNNRNTKKGDTSVQS